MMDITDINFEYAYYNNQIVVDTTTKDCYEVVLDRRTGEEILKSIDVSFNCAYVGSAKGETFWVERSIVEEKLGANFSFEDFINEDWGDNMKWTDFGFKEIGDLEDYVITFEHRFFEINDFDTICKSEDLV